MIAERQNTHISLEVDCRTTTSRVTFNHEIKEVQRGGISESQVMYYRRKDRNLIQRIAEGQRKAFNERPI